MNELEVKAALFQAHLISSKETNFKLLWAKEGITLEIWWLGELVVRSS
jgi:hypothetical protein